MRIFHLTSLRFEGHVELKFNDEDRFIAIDFIESGVNVEQQKWILQSLPSNVHALGMYDKYKDSMTVTEIIQNITFEIFWERYNDKISSSKKKSAARWNKMPAAEQAKAYRYIGRYLASIPAGTRKKYAETYLNAELWNN